MDVLICWLCMEGLSKFGEFNFSSSNFIRSPAWNLFLENKYNLGTTTRNTLDMNMRISHEHHDVRLRAWSYFHLEAKIHMFRNSRKEIKEWVFNTFLYKSLDPRKSQFATFFSQLIVSKFLGVTRDLGLTV